MTEIENGESNPNDYTFDFVFWRMDFSDMYWVHVLDAKFLALNAQGFFLYAQNK